MKNLISLLPLVSFLVGCGSKSDSSSTASKPGATYTDQQIQQADTATDYSKIVTPYSFTVTKANLSYDEERQRYTNNCTTQGQPNLNGPVGIDPQLKPGVMFREQTANSRILTENVLQTTAATVTEATSQKISYEMNFEALLMHAPFTSIDQIYTSRPHVVITRNITAAQNGYLETSYDYQPNFTPEAIAAFQEQMGVANQNIWCRIDYKASPASSQKVDLISYNFYGRPVTAYMTTSTQTGSVICEKTDSSGTVLSTIAMGTGNSQTIAIDSNDVMSDALADCGGRQIYWMSRVILDSGKVLNSSVTKLLSVSQTK